LREIDAGSEPPVTRIEEGRMGNVLAGVQIAPSDVCRYTLLVDKREMFS
jgi:hypothetical protein